MALINGDPKFRRAVRSKFLVDRIRNFYAALVHSIAPIRFPERVVSTRELLPTMAKVPAAKRRRLSPPEDLDSSPEPHTNGAKSTSRGEWDEEQDYENRPRTHTKTKNQNNRLPIRTELGWVAQQQEPVVEENGAESESVVDSGEDMVEEEDDEEEFVKEEPKLPHRVQVLQAKEQLAKLASQVNEDPEEHIGSLRAMAEISDRPNTTVKKLALAAQASVYKDIIPGYRIRSHLGDDSKSKLSKEVRRLHNFEQGLVRGYQDYIKKLAEHAKGSKTADKDLASLATTAISCTSTLLISVPHFNFRSELLKILVNKLSQRRVDENTVKCRETLQTIFRSDDDGYVSHEAVQMLTKMIKAKNYNVDEGVINTFLHLRLLSEFTHKASNTSVDRNDEDEDDDNSKRGKKMKQKREFLTKRQRKARRENKAIEEEMRQADAAVSHEERDRMQAETLKLVFVTYFRILKSRAPRLMGAVLEGLARYAHLINQDFFGDILEALKDLINDEMLENAGDENENEEDQNDSEEAPIRDATRQSLLCVITAFALLQGQDATKAASNLQLDLSFFITHLYSTLIPISLNPDIELSSKSLHLPDPTSGATPQRAQQSLTAKVNVQTTSVLLLRSLSATLLPANLPARAVPPVRIAAFARQLLAASLHLPEKTVLAMLALLQRVVKVHGRRVAALWHTDERRGDGVWDPLAREVERSNPFAGTSWEAELLRKHYAPDVRDAVKALDKGIVASR
jgi:nucleolar complex protein 3